MRKSLDTEMLPSHVGVIMDGNGRWAKKRGLPRSAGHAAGANTLKKIAKYADKLGIKVMTVYAFSTENWKRPKPEVDELMKLLSEYLSDAKKQLTGERIRIKVIGDIGILSATLQEKIRETEDFSKDYKGMLLNIAINYGGRNEIVNAVKCLAKDVENKRLSSENIDEKTIENYLYTNGQPDPDLIIRPSGEMRLSNFLMWQSAYSEFWFSNICWPDFNEKQFLKALTDYQNRNRRFGGI